MNEMKIGFEMRKIRLPLEDILPMRQIKEPHKKSGDTKRFWHPSRKSGWLSRSWFIRKRTSREHTCCWMGICAIVALKELGETTADCIIANDDECFTYNARISRLPPIQEHKMIVKAVNNGVSPERIAAALNMPLNVVQRDR